MLSTVIRYFFYEPGVCTLRIKFVSGRRYAYHDVPADLADVMRNAFSEGGYFSQHIPRRYRFTREQ
jgi:hypothetical protein